jgi:hypothetical protein
VEEIMKKMLVILLPLVLFSLPADAATYRWEDEHGTMNYTEDPGTIPAQYRKKATIVGSEDLPPAPESTEGKEEQKPTKPMIPAAAKQEVPAEKKKAVYGDKDADGWRREFYKLKQGIKGIDEQLGVKKAMIADPSKLTRLEYRSLEYEIKSLEAERSTLQKKLDDLSSAADRADVPADARE